MNRIRRVPRRKLQTSFRKVNELRFKGFGNEKKSIKNC